MPSEKDIFESTLSGVCWSAVSSWRLGKLFSPLTNIIVDPNTGKFIISQAAVLYFEMMASAPIGTYLDYKFNQIEFAEIDPNSPIPDNLYQEPLI